MSGCSCTPPPPTSFSTQVQLCWGIQSERVILAEIRVSKHHLTVCLAFFQAVWSFHLVTELFGEGFCLNCSLLCTVVILFNKCQA